MPLTIKQLESLWNKDKISYKTQEVGSGVQRFVKEVLQCEELFNLKEGRLSTPINKRKNEFIHERKAKEHRHVDYVIYITEEVKIPIEVEQYTNINAGKKQLLQYQVDLDRKYGILTDGYTWQFYNNNVYREFTLKQIFYETRLFLEFWKEYIKTEYYYLSFFEGTKGQQFLFRDIEKLGVEHNREIFFEDITKLIGSFKEKLKLEHYFNGLTAPEREQKATEISYAYIIQFILYKTLVDNAFKDFGGEYEEYLGKTYKYLKDGRYKDILSIVDNISSKISENIYRPFMKEQEYIHRRFEQLYRKVENQLSDISPWLDIFVFIKKYSFENVQNEIFGYIYENYLKELFAEEKRGQYFTDPAVVNFMIQQIGYTDNVIKEKIQNNQLDKLSLLDPACGSGTFLYSAVDQIIKSSGSDIKNTSENIEDIVTKNVFGLDIEEFPLYLAEMNILMRMLSLIITERYNNPVDKKIKTFLTEDSIAEFIGSSIENTRTDEYVRKGQIEFGYAIQEPKYDSFMRIPEDIKEMKESLRSNHIPRHRFDYVIGNPPYVGYNECSKQGILIFKMLQGKVKPKVNLNNIYGMNLHSIPGHSKKYAPKPNLYAFFIAVGLALLKDDGKLCYIIPQTILTAGDLDVLRYHLAKFTTIEKIITFNSNLFISRGLKQKKVVPTSSLIFVVSKKPPTDEHKVEIINYKNGEDSIIDTLNNILNGKKTDKKKIQQSELFKNVVNWNFIKQDKIFLDFYNEYKKNSDDMAIYYEHKRAENQFKNRFYFDKGLVYPKNKIIDATKIKTGTGFYLVKLNHNKYLTEILARGVLKNDVNIPHGSQGFKVFERKYKIIWSYMNYDHFYFADKNIMINFNFVVISSDSKNELLYLLSILNSQIIHFVFDRNLSSKREKDILLGIKTVKEYVRVPKITKENQFIKDEIIKRTEEMLSLEEKTLSDFVDFSGVMLQKFDDVEIDGNNLVLKHNGNKTKLEVKSDVKLISETIQKELKKELKLENQKINLADLKNLPVIDFDKQKKLKDYVDDLVFALYFNIPLKKVKFSEVEKVKGACSKNRYFAMVTEYQR